MLPVVIKGVLCSLGF
jgi:chromatin modification-related protein EAF6